MAKTSAGETAAIELMQRVATPAEAPRGDRTPEGLADLFAPDIVLPEQFFEGARRDSYISGEKALMLAVLEDGIRCFQEHLRNPRSNPRLLSREAEDWIRAVDYDWPFSFNNVCETLGISPFGSASVPAGVLISRPSIDKTSSSSNRTVGAAPRALSMTIW